MKNKKNNWFRKYIKETWKNKLCAVAFTAIGIFGVTIDSNGTGALFLWMLAIILFFSNKNWLY